MKKNLLLVMGAAVMLAFGISSCSSDDDDNNIRNEDLSYLQDKTWFFKNQHSVGSIIDESINYCFHSDGILEVIDDSEYGPLFLAPGKYEYDVQLQNQPNIDAIISGTLVIDNKHCTFEIYKDSDNPKTLSLRILYSTASSFSHYGFTLNK